MMALHSLKLPVLKQVLLVLCSLLTRRRYLLVRYWKAPLILLLILRWLQAQLMLLGLQLVINRQPQVQLVTAIILAALNPRQGLVH
jgi:hypothetical protein